MSVLAGFDWAGGEPGWGQGAGGDIGLVFFFFMAWMLGRVGVSDSSGGLLLDEYVYPGCKKCRNERKNGPQTSLPVRTADIMYTERNNAQEINNVPQTLCLR